MQLERKVFLFNEKKQPTRALLRLLDLCGISHQGTLESILSAIQQAWYQRDLERWQFAGRFEEKKDTALEILKELGCIDRVIATRLHYLYGILLGGYTPRMLERVGLLGDEWRRGVRFDHLVVLIGERPLDPATEPLSPLIQHETDMLLHLLKEADLPSELRKIPLKLVNVKMKSTKRPNTLDTIVAWLKDDPQPGTCLIFADQPLLGYFDAVFRTYLPSDFSIETIGGAADQQLLLAVFLDNLTRSLYQELERMSTK